MQRVDHVAQHQCLGGEQAACRVVGEPFHHPALEIELDDGTAGHPAPQPGGEKGRSQQQPAEREQARGPSQCLG